MTEPGGGYCYIENSSGDWDPIQMGDLRPGDRFKFIVEEGLLEDIVMDETAPVEQRRDVLQGLLHRAQVYRFDQETSYDPVHDNSSCDAYPVEE